jgi:mevalonate kinase
MSVTASAPGKVILFGEHAVVYGEPALAGAINRRVYATVKSRDDDKISITSNHELRDGYPYVKNAVDLTFEFLGKRGGLDIEIDAEFPPASGLGSSASVSVSTIKAVSTLLGTEIGKKDIARLGHLTEKRVQGAASITDSSVTTFGGVLLIKPKLELAEAIDVGNLPLVIGYTGKSGSTKEQVRLVKDLRDKNPDFIDPIIHTIGRITIKAKNEIEKGGDIGELMNLNHGLLEALGVGTETLSRYVYAARTAGAAGAKITGAGGGGCIVAYSPGNQEAVAGAIRERGGLALKVSIEEEGVRLEQRETIK